jgi:hypothetical protein
VKSNTKKLDELKTSYLLLTVKLSENGICVETAWMTSVSTYVVHWSLSAQFID